MDDTKKKGKGFAWLESAKRPAPVQQVLTPQPKAKAKEIDGFTVEEQCAILDAVKDAPHVEMWVLITPEMANDWLTSRNTKNRPISERRARAIAADIEHNRYGRTHQGVAFNVLGILADGQHRLAAICIAGVPVLMRVTFGLPEESIGRSGRWRRARSGPCGGSRCNTLRRSGDGGRAPRSRLPPVRARRAIWNSSPMGSGGAAVAMSSSMVAFLLCRSVVGGQRGEPGADGLRGDPGDRRLAPSAEQRSLVDAKETRGLALSVLADEPANPAPLDGCQCLGRPHCAPFEAPLCTVRTRASAVSSTRTAREKTTAIEGLRPSRVRGVEHARAASSAMLAAIPSTASSAAKASRSLARSSSAGERWPPMGSTSAPRSRLTGRAPGER